MIDIHNDDDLVLLTKIAEEEPLPDFVKQADASLLATPSELPKEAFALESKRLYPMFDKASAWLSSRYFTKSAKEIPEPARLMVEGKLKRACSLFGIEWPVETHGGASVKLAESDFAMVEKYEDKTVVKYPVNTKESTERSIGHFGSECALYPTEWRRAAAEVLLKKANEFGVTIHHSSPVLKYTCRTKSPDTINMAMSLRARYTKSEEFSKLYRDLVEKSAQEHPDTIMGAVELLDNASGLARFWDNGIPDPYLSVYKKAEENGGEDYSRELKIEAIKGAGEDEGDETETKYASQSIALAERNVPLSQLTQMPLEWYNDLLGEDIAEEIADGGEIDEEKLKMILASLPRPSQLLIVSNLPV